MPQPQPMPATRLSTTREYRFVNRDHRAGYTACPASGSPVPSGAGAFYARCPACGASLDISGRRTLPRHKAARPR